MSSINKVKSIHTHEGAKAKRINPEQELRRSVMSCMLWEKEFYESGESIAQRIVNLVAKVSPEICSQIAIEARHDKNLRHVPLLICSAMAKHHGGKIVAETVENVISRADELSELIVIHCAVNGVGADEAKKVLSNQMKKGIAKAFNKFNEYQLAKYDRKGAVTLRDAMFLTHPKPVDKKQHYVFKRLAEDKLKTPDTWEVALSGGEDKKESFERLLKEGKLGYLALLRNLRNMVGSGVDSSLVKSAILERKGANKVLPFRFVAAAKYAPAYANELNTALCYNIQESSALKGKTIVLVDVSGSMSWGLVSAKSELTRMDAAASLASVVNSEDLRVFSFSNSLVECPAYKGLPGIQSIINSQAHRHTDLGGAVDFVNKNFTHDRLIVITDEQSSSRVPDPICKDAYMINVASFQNGVGYGKWTHIDGFSESVIRFINELESDQS